MKSNSQTTIFLEDYRAPTYCIDSIDLLFDLYNEKTIVHSKLQCRKNEKSNDQNEHLILHGEKLILVSVHLDGRQLNETEYQVDEKHLTIFKVPERFNLEIKTEIHPQKNTELSGLYRAKSIFCTQCEAEGFRRIIYYLDRPDVMAKFSTTIYADKTEYPMLLSNGNCVDKGNVDVKRHWVKWEDPFLKPAYLFALVAGDLVAVEDAFVTMSGRLITLKIYVERENQDKCEHAMEALKKSMKWDEITYGREYDLDIYMIVAVNDFNMGAMENKGLNIFNSKYILARPETATDTDYQLIDAVVGHEYFHNWSGNRVTCRDWFQLSLKEGLTVFREHHFSTDITKSPVSLIENVRHLRSQQFAEDSGPMAHPVRPDSYIEINNFYTATVYEKGSQLIRMIECLLGKEKFRLAMDHYFKKHDGQAVTTDDFVVAMEEASDVDLSQFRLWYSQAGTPLIEVQDHYNSETQTYQLTLKQSCPPTPHQPIKAPMVIPVKVGLLDQKGNDILKTEMLVLNEAEKTFTYKAITTKPILSVLREFSAPVKIQFNQDNEQLAFLLAHDSDDFNRWESGQKLTERLIWQLLEDYKMQKPLIASKLWIDAHQAILVDQNLSPALKAEILTLPSIAYLLELKKTNDIDGLHVVRTFLKRTLVEKLGAFFAEAYHLHAMPGLYRYTHTAVANRSLKNLCLSYLMQTEEPIVGLDLCMKQWSSANNMTDSVSVLVAMSNWEGSERQKILAEFYERWQYNPLVLDKWFRIQALSELPNTLDIVKGLMQNASFEITNPNKVYSLIGAFTANLVRFHDQSGEGYTFLADCVIELDPLNPLVAARMVRAFSSWKKFDEGRQDKIRGQLKRILMQDKLSKDISEVVTKCLAADLLND